MSDKQSIFKNSSSEDVRKAYEIAKKAHKGQVDKAGKDYILHPVTVASYVGNDEEAIIVALLHDVIEDTNITISVLSKEFSPEIISALKCVTHDEDEPYMDYIKRIKSNKLATKVKLADLKHNMDLSRFTKVSNKDMDRVKNKYIPAWEYLTGRKYKKVIEAFEDE